jgi:hypothetical protein
MSAFFDDGFPADEQLPRYLDVSLTAETCPSGPPVARMTINGSPAGDPLTDVGWRFDTDDEPLDDEEVAGARWHDAVHIAHAVALGWSPVLRELTGRQRHSDPRIAVHEDGPAAVLAEEAVAWAVFRHARTGAAGAEAEARLLATIRELTAGLEVSARTDQEWTSMIRMAVRCLQAVWVADGGLLTGDLRSGTLKFTPQPVRELAGARG